MFSPKKLIGGQAIANPSSSKVSKITSLSYQGGERLTLAQLVAQWLLEKL
jgi:hypothetical protein